MTIIKDTPDSSSFVQVGTSFAQIASGPYSVTTLKESGTYINGPVGISSSIDNVKFAGIFRFNPALSTCIPSTMITPIPTLIIDLPISNISSMVSIAAMIATIM